MAAHGQVAVRVLWSNDERPLRDGLRAVAAGARPHKAEREPRLVPMLRGLGTMHDVLPGREARRDVLRAAPPMYGLARLAGVFRPLPPLARSIAALGTVAAAGLAAVAGVQRLASTRSG